MEDSLIVFQFAPGPMQALGEYFDIPAEWTMKEARDNQRDVKVSEDITN